MILPILGADFIAHHNLLVDVQCQQLLKNNRTPDDLVFHALSSGIPEITAEFPAVFRSELAQDPKLPAKHNVRHHIKTSGPPIFSKFRRLSPEKLQVAKHCFRELEQQGICQKSSSPWSSPLHMVSKKDGTFRPCGDYRRLNNITEPDHYPLPNIQDITSYLNGAKIFSKLDLTKGYYQVPLNPDDIPKTAITTPFGTYTFNYSCFGLRNAGATFQRLMDDIFGDLDFVVIYIDDILVYSSSEQQHLEHLRIILQRLQDNGLVLKPDKCLFAQPSVEFLGHMVSQDGLTPLQDKVTAVQDFPTPSSVKKLQEFLGMVTYYHRFLPNIASTLAPPVQRLEE